MKKCRFYSKQHHGVPRAGGYETHKLGQIAHKLVIELAS